MKVQHLAVIFVIIIIPISLVMTQYLQTQINTINLQTEYNTKLITATHDALKAFQINSVNNKYTSVSDSKIRDIEASINTFYNSLGMAIDDYTTTRQNLSTFVPAILFTLYDGYYICSSYYNGYDPKAYPAVISSSSDVNVKITDVEDVTESLNGHENYKEGLKPYIYYSCEYVNPGNDTKKVIINYTLDNAITVYGKLKDTDGTTKYLTKSGYLINPNDVTEINPTRKTLKYKGIKIEPEELEEHLIIVDDRGGHSEEDYPYIIHKNKKVYLERSTGKYFWYYNYKKVYLETEKEEVDRYVNVNGFKSISAYEYYKNAYDFTRWLTVTNSDIFGNIKQSWVKDADSLSVSTGNTCIFAFNNTTNDPMRADSIFNAHREAIIRKSIETNLSAAIVNYNKQGGLNSFQFVMPTIDEENWYSITNNVSIAAFLQGMPIGYKYYNNYCVITNTRNEEVINAQSLYVLVEKGNSAEYHKPGCETLINQTNTVGGYTKITAYTDLSFMRQTVKLSEDNNIYFYPHEKGLQASRLVGNNYTTGCYNCIVNANAEFDIDDIISGTAKKIDGTVAFNATQLSNVRKAYLTGLARERYDLYKSNFDLK